MSIDILDTRPEDVKADWLGLATLYEEDEDVFSVRASFFGNHRWFHCLREIGLFVFSADLFVIGVVTFSFSWNGDHLLIRESTLSSSLPSSSSSSSSSIFPRNLELASDKAVLLNDRFKVPVLLVNLLFEYG